jgi:DtxR family Mn-dependent transcriptional regulator
MLRYLSEQGIELGDRVEVTGRQPFGGPVFVRVAGRELPLGGQLAQAMRIEVGELRR